MGTTDTDNTFHPTGWDEYVGQERSKLRLRREIAAAKARGVPLGHVLIKGGSGLGKTSLARLIAAETGGVMQVEADPIAPAHVPYIFDDLKDGDVLFLDEMHRQFAGRGTKAEWLLCYLEQGEMSNGRGGLEPAPQVTVIGATTDGGRIPKTTQDRFSLVLTLDPYTPEEAGQIVQGLAGKILDPEGMSIPDDATAAAIATACSCQPRIIRRLLLGLRTLILSDVITDDGSGTYALDEAFAWADVTFDGLTLEMQEYLQVLHKARGEAMGEKAIADRIGEVGDGMKMIEGPLLDKDLIAKTKGGRILTSAGRKRAKQLVDAAS